VEYGCLVQLWGLAVGEC